MVSTPGRIRRFVRWCRRGKPTPTPAPGRSDIVTCSEVNYFGLANSLIDEHGIHARAEAARLMYDALREEDQLAVQDWLAVEQAIALLTNACAGPRH